jgi:hypothetical protein
MRRETESECVIREKRKTEKDKSDCISWLERQSRAYYWLVAGGWFVLRGKYCWLVADKPNEQAANPSLMYSSVM